MKKKSFLLFLSLSCAPFFNTVHAENNATILSENSSGLVFRIDNNYPQIDTVFTAGNSRILIRFQHQSGNFNHNGLSFPEITTIIAIPPGNYPLQTSLLNAKWLPCNADMPLIQAAQQLPASEKLRVVSLAGTGWVRDLRIAQIRTVPLRWQNGEWQYLAQAQIQLRWPAVEKSAATKRTQAQIKIAHILNAADVPAFIRRRPARGLAKRSQQSGKQFIRLEIEDNGIYRISGAMLTQAGISLSSLEPGQIRMYNGGGRALPEKVSATRPQSLIEIPIILLGAEDGRFDNTDAILFFGQSVNDWQFSKSSGTWLHYINHYETRNVYWLSWDSQTPAALRLDTEPATANAVVAGFGLQLHAIENELQKIYPSGRDWFGNPLSVGDSENFTFRFNNPHSANSYLRLRIVSDNNGRPNTLSVSLNNSPERLFSFNSSGTGDYKNIGSTTQRFSQFESETSGNNTLQVSYKSTTGSAKTYVDWIEFIVEDSLLARNGELSFATTPTDAAQSFSLSGFSSEPYILEISNPTAPRLLAVAQVDLAWQFTDDLADSAAHRYFAATSFKEPVNLSKYTYSHLRDGTNRADMLIVAPEIFIAEAERLAAHKRSFRGFEVEVIDISTIVQEFGWGLNDPTALRDFIKFTFENWQKAPRFVVLFGDGTYDYKNIESAGTDNHIITYQTTESAELSNRNIEAYFTYVSGDDRMMDLAIGRMPVQTVDDAALFVDKIIQYEADPEYGVWRNKITMVADDELYENGTPTFPDMIHVEQAEELMQSNVPDYLIQQKIYLMNYRAIRNSAVLGVRKPEAQNDLIEAINSGSLIVNYIGHGNPTVWAHERIFVQNEDIPKMANGARQAFFVAATCDFGRFDDPRRQSFTEDLLNMAGGAIGFLTSSRVVFARSNAVINSQFYKQLFLEKQNLQTVGEALMNARLYTNAITNDEKFTIIGDPSMILAVPTSIARVNAVNPDTLLSLSTTAVSGDLFLGTGERIDTPGQVQVLVFDDDRDVKYVSAINATANYVMPGNIIFRGRSSVENGRFAIDFLVPKDITYGGRNAGIKIYGTGESWEAAGTVNGLPISLRSAVLQDSQGPEIEINFSGRQSFSNGDPIPANALLAATLRDEISGINVTGEIGHKIVLTIDGDSEKPWDLTDDFIYFENDHLAGKVIAQLPALPVGFHTAELKAWDNSNNSSKLSFDFQITEAGELVLRDVLNYPNPFRESTTFTFLLNRDAEIDIAVYTVSGRKIRKIEGIFGISGYNEIFWDGRDADGDRLANGIYLYRIQAKAQIDARTERTEFIGKAAVNY